MKHVKICDDPGKISTTELGILMTRLASLTLALSIAVAANAAAQAADSPAWLRASAAEKTVDLDLAVTRPDGAPSALINGAANGAIQVVVPQRWTVRWHWVNQDSSAAHSLVVMAEREKLPQEGGRAVFTNAMTRAVTTGLPAGGKDDTSFEAEDAGWYWLLCGVPGHAIAGEWIGFRVDPAATEPAVNRK